MWGGKVMFNEVLIKKELKENKWILIIGLILLITGGLINTLSYEAILKLFQTQADVSIPGIDKAYLENLKDFNFYTWSSWYDKSYLQMLSLLVVILGMGTIAKEVTRDTIGFLLTKPFSRGQVFLNKFSAGVIIIVILGLVSSIFQYLIADVLGRGIDTSFLKYILGFISSLPGELMLYSLGVLFSTLFVDGLKAGLLTGGVALALTIPSYFPDYHDYNVYKYFIPSDIYTLGTFGWLPFISLSLVTVVIYYLGLQLFNRKQF
jgi:ABC-2 type transport system permease protein